MRILLDLEDVLNTYKSRKAGRDALRAYSSWFPLEATGELAGIVADIISDGHLQGEPKWRIDFTFKLTEDKERFENSLIEMFKVKGKVRRCLSNEFSTTYNYGVNCGPLARTLMLCGVPQGNKVLNKFTFPDWILSNKIFFREFARKFYSREGTCWGGESPGIGFEMWKEISILDDCRKFLESMRLGLKKFFDIETTNIFTTVSKNERKDGYITKPLKFYIKRKDSIFKFYREIGFENRNQEKLKKIVEKWGSFAVGTERP